MLQVNALLVAGSSWSGLLQDHACDALAVCAKSVCSRSGFLARCNGCAASVGRIAGQDVANPLHRSSVPRTALQRLTDYNASQNLVRSPVFSQLHGMVCLGVILTGARIVEFRRKIPLQCGTCVWLALALLICAPAVFGQGAAPETAPPLFPGGGLVSYNSIFTTRGLLSGPVNEIPSTARPTFSHEGDFNFTWGFYRNLDLTVLLPIVTNDFQMIGTPTVGGTGLGDAMVLVKYRFYRRDSERGTTQASFTLGLKIPTGRTDLSGSNGTLLPASLQPGSGSTDLFAAANWTYTGLFNLRRLVADEDFHALIRSKGTQATRLGNDLESRFWLSYRPYESKDGAREWFIGPVLTWLHAQDDRIAGVTQSGSGGDMLLAGATTYVGVRPGMHLWFGMDWDVVHSTGAAFMPVRRHISFGITQQFRMKFFK